MKQNYSDTNGSAEKPVFPLRLSYIHPDLKIGIEENEVSEPEEGQRTVHVMEQFIWIRVLEGSVRFEVNLRNITVSAGETLFINSRQPHAYRGTVETPLRLRVLIAAPDAVRVPYLDKQLEKMMADSSFSSLVIRPASPLFSYDMDTIFDLARHRPEAYEFEVVAKYISLLRQYIRIYSHTNPNDTVRKDTDLESLREMLAFIGENFREEITVDEIAAAGKMSRSKCTRLFRKHLQKSPIEHVQQYRLERSVYLLKNTDLPFSEIALMCGFNQQSYFNRLFAREYGMTPRQMRRSDERH